MAKMCLDNERMDTLRVALILAEISSRVNICRTCGIIIRSYVRARSSLLLFSPSFRLSCDSPVRTRVSWDFLRIHFLRSIRRTTAKFYRKAMHRAGMLDFAYTYAPLKIYRARVNNVRERINSRAHFISRLIIRRVSAKKKEENGNFYREIYKVRNSFSRFRPRTRVLRIIHCENHVSMRLAETTRSFSPFVLRFAKHSCFSISSDFFLCFVAITLPHTRP